jgi:2-methylcitrate dehydratase PrpD
MQGGLVLSLSKGEAELTNDDHTRSRSTMPNDRSPVSCKDAASLFEALLPVLYAPPRRALAGEDARVRLLLLDTIGCTVAGLADPAVQRMAQGLGRDGGSTRLPGLAQRLERSAASFVAGMAACWDEACEGLPEAHGRPGLHAVAAVLPEALESEAPLGQLLWAIATAYEIGGRAGQICRIRPGMHVDGSWGLLAAVAAVAAFRYPERPALLADALGIAACQIPFSLYAPIAQGSVARNTYVGHAASLAGPLVEAAAAGVPGVAGALDGYLKLALGREQPPQAAHPEERLLARGYLKPFAAVRHVHYPAFAAIHLRAALRGREEAIRRIVLETYGEAIQYCGNRAPRTAIQAQFSLSYGTAHALRHGDLDPSAYRRAALGDGRAKAIEAMIELKGTERPDGRRYARLAVALADGTVLTEDVTEVPGDPDNPMPPSDVVAKFVRFTQATVGVTVAQDFARRLLAAAPGETCRAVFSVLARDQTH